MLSTKNLTKLPPIRTLMKTILFLALFTMRRGELVNISCDIFSVFLLICFVDIAFPPYLFIIFLFIWQLACRALSASG